MRWTAGLVVIATLGLVAVPARAEDVTPDAAATKDARATAERYFRAGEQAYKAQSFAAAAKHFEEAYKALPLPEIAFSAAQAYRRHYRTDSKLAYAQRAVELYKLYLDAVKTGGRVGIAADSLGEMQREVDKLTAAGARMTPVAPIARRTAIAINPMLGNEQAGAMSEVGDLPADSATKITATLDGKPAPLYESIDVAPGPHAIRVEADGYQPYAASHRVLDGQDDVVEVRLVPRPARVTIRTERGARVRVDGRPLTTALDAPFEVPAGTHLVTIARRGRISVAREITVGRGEELAVTAPLEKTARRRAIPYVATAAGLLGVITLAGAGVALSQDSKADDQLAAIRAGDQRPEAADRYERLIRRRDEVVMGSVLTGSLTLLAAGAAVALYAFDRPSEDSMQIKPAIGPGAAGVTLGGRF